MRRTRLLMAVFILTALYTAYIYSNTMLKESVTRFHSHNTGLKILEPEGKELWVEIHDVSPAYQGKLEEVLEVLNEHPTAYSKVVLFVIPNHGGVAPMQDYPEFVSKLKALESRGFVLGLHGYTHEEPMLKPEFKTGRAEADQLLRASEEGFNASGLGFPSHFLPPGWQTTREADGLLREKFGYVYYYYYIDSPQGIIPSQSLEYIWHDYSYKALDRAQWDYANLKGVIRVTIHLGAINNEKGLTFLHQYLSWIEEKE